MAFSFVTQPTLTVQAARSPIIYEVTESTATDEFKYILDIYIHDTATVPGSYDYRLVCSTDASGNGRFDVSDIVLSELEANYTINDTPAVREDAGSAVRYITTKGGYIDASGTITAAAATSGSVVATMGYLNYKQATNAGNYVGSAYTSLPTSGFSLPYTSTFYLAIRRTDVSAISYTTNLGESGGASAGTTSTTASVNFRYIHCSPSQLGMDVAASWYDLTVGTATYRVNIECEPKYDTYTLMFVNKFGFWDYLYFFKQSQEEITTTAEGYKRINPSATTSPSHIVYSKDGNESITLNTGWVSEDMNEAYKQLMLSEHIQLVESSSGSVGGIREAVKIEDTQLSYKQGVNEKLINYTFKFNYAFDAINKTW